MNIRIERKESMGIRSYSRSDQTTNELVLFYDSLSIISMAIKCTIHDSQSLRVHAGVFRTSRRLISIPKPIKCCNVYTPRCLRDV